MKICLVRPATITTADAAGEDSAPPFGCAYLAGSVRHVGHEVSIVDALGLGLDRYSSVPELPTGLRHGLEDDETVALIPGDVQIIGVTCMFSLEWTFTRDLMILIREHFPDATIVVGGEHITALPAYCMKDCPAIDYCVAGEGEQTLVDLVTTLDKGLPIFNVPGIFYRQGGTIVASQARKRIRELDTIPRPAWDLTPIRNYLDSGTMIGVNFGRSMPILASRGCPYQCTFCSNPGMWGTLWRVRSPQEVFTEIMDYKKEYGASNFDFYDLTAIVKKQWIVDFCHLLINNNANITWQLPSGTRSEAIDAEVTKLLFQAGCVYLTYAPESGSPVTLERIKKKISTKKMLASMDDAIANGISTKANIILGFPDETLWNVLQSYWFIVRMAMVGINDVVSFPFSPYPGSELFKVCLERGMVTINDAYFISLSQYSDIRYTKSYSQHFTSWQLRILCLTGMALFYASSYLARPVRAWRLVSNVLKKSPKTKLESAIVRVLKKRSRWTAASYS
jgi:radical SAM superfamily enzyme YgiQ (UPF0313 family)